MEWLAFVKKFREDNPHMSFKDALKKCSEPFKKHKKQQKYKEPKLKRKKKESCEDEVCGCNKILKRSTKKSMRDTIKQECGICPPKKGAPKKPTKIKIVGSSSSKRRTTKSAKQKRKTKS